MGTPGEDLAGVDSEGAVPVTPSAASVASSASAAHSAIAVNERPPQHRAYCQAKDGRQPAADTAAVPGIGDRAQDGQQVSAVPGQGLRDRCQVADGSISR